jgi:hypothetical protein
LNSSPTNLERQPRDNGVRQCPRPRWTRIGDDVWSVEEIVGLVHDEWN